jgi:hypothetical protein
MTTQEANTILKTDAVAQSLLHSTYAGHLAYLWKDGKPRVVPMWFLWTGEEIVMGAPPNSPKMKVLADHPDIAFSIDKSDWPYQVLSVRGTAAITIVDQPIEKTFPEYVAMARRYLGEEGSQQFLGLHNQTFSGWIRIAVRPEEVRILDLSRNFPSAWVARDGKSAG